MIKIKLCVPAFSARGKNEKFSRKGRKAAKFIRRQPAKMTQKHKNISASLRSPREENHEV